MDREKVIKAWEIFRDSNPYEICSGREFRAIREPEYCMGQMIEDTIALLKELDPVEPELEGGGSTWWNVCGECHGAIDISDYFCKHCGRRIKHEKKAE